jgi:hypothetical protein
MTPRTERILARRGQVTCPQVKPVDSPCGVRDLTTAPRTLLQARLASLARKPSKEIKDSIINLKN